MKISPTELNIYLAMFSFYTTKERFRYYEPNITRGYLGRFSRLRENGYENIIESHRFSERHTLNLVKNFLKEFTFRISSSKKNFQSPITP
jgi:hypothetical protein